MSFPQEPTVESAGPLEPSETVQEQVREAVAEQRQQSEHQQATLHTRAVAELDQPSDPQLSQEVRDLTTEQRQYEAHRQTAMHHRAADEVSR